MKTLSALLLLLSLSALASPFVKPSEVSGILNMNTPKPSQYIIPVYLYTVDDNQILRRNNSVWMKPGKYNIKVNLAVPLDNRTQTILTRQKLNTPIINRSLELTIEEGKTYYVGYDTRDRNPNKWRPVVWKVK